MRYGRLVALVTLVAALAAAAAPGTASAGGQGESVGGPLHTDGRWFRDPLGRVVVLHGLFAVWKGEPFYPPDDAALPNGFTNADADRLAALGFDAVRLAWFWRGLEPVKDGWDPAYLAGIASVQQKLSRRGVFTVLDSHQDGFGDRFNGLGFPDYVTHDDGLAFDPGLGFPLNYFSPATQRAFDNFYADQGDAWRSYGRAWQHVARRLGRDPMLVGYDLMNEPWPGSAFGGCVPPAGCPELDRTTLQPLFDSLARSIRAVDRHRPVFYEPHIFFNQGAVNGYVKPPRGTGPVGLSFHNQCPTRAQWQVTHDPTLVEKARTICPPIETSVMRNAEATAARLGGPPLMTEVAATTNDDFDGLNCLLERSERFMTGYTYGLSWRSGELRNLAEAKAEVIARVYPRAVAGTPVHYRFDVRTGRFVLVYVTRRGTRGPTVITVPRALHYPEGYRVWTAGGRVVRQGGDRVVVENRRRAGVVAVVIEPPAGDATVRPALLPCGG
ncbi:MAG: cellulase family glycosylhydrolase [Thermoleophilaceae bacterium]|nr:cellulase family glycosylhydrolase [Thermoleophilaceae bacterium]